MEPEMAPALSLTGANLGGFMHLNPTTCAGTLLLQVAVIIQRRELLRTAGQTRLQLAELVIL